MVDGRPDHPGDGRHGLEHHSAMTVALGEKGVGAPAQHLGDAKSYAVGQALGLVVDAKIDESGLHETSPEPARSRIVVVESELALSRPFRYLDDLPTVRSLRIIPEVTMAVSMLEPVRCVP